MCAHAGFRLLRLFSLLLLLASCESEHSPPPLPEPEETLSVGPFEIGRWKHFYARGDNFQDRGDFYWESVLKYRNEVVDFCTPQGWGGSSLCSTKEYRGAFRLSTPSVISENPPAVLVPYGGGDGELWLFTDREGRLEKKRIALLSSFGVTDLRGERIDYSKDWDSRSHHMIMLNNDTWFMTDSLRVLEFSKPVGTLYLQYLSTSPDGRFIARIGYIGNERNRDASKLVLVVNDMNDPGIVMTYSVSGLKGDRMSALSDDFGRAFSWTTPSSEGMFKAEREGVKLVPFATILERALLSQTPDTRETPDMDYFFDRFSEDSLVDVSTAILKLFGEKEDCECIIYTENSATLVLGDWGRYVLKEDGEAIHLSKISEQGSVTHLAHVLKESILNNEFQLPNEASSQPKRPRRQDTRSAHHRNRQLRIPLSALGKEGKRMQ